MPINAEAQSAQRNAEEKRGKQSSHDFLGLSLRPQRLCVEKNLLLKS
jgi:hypothetical protein